MCIACTHKGGTPKVRYSIAVGGNPLASIQLTVGGNQAGLDARTEFEISQRSPKGGWKLVMHMAIFGSLAKYL